MTSLTNSRLGLARWLEAKTGGEQQVPLKQLMERCHNKPFYCNQHPSNVADCCTWHNILPPEGMNGLPSPLHPFQQNIIAELEKTHRLAVVKARNLGLTALALRYALHLTLSKQLAGNYLFVTGVGYILSSTL